jgi:hypothetical protein
MNQNVLEENISPDHPFINDKIKLIHTGKRVNSS